MCQFQHRNSQFLPTHPTDKIGHPPKTLPWTDKFFHFVRFETKTPPQSERQGGCVMRCPPCRHSRAGGNPEDGHWTSLLSPARTVERRRRILRADRSLDSRLRGNDEHQTRLCHASFVFQFSICNFQFAFCNSQFAMPLLHSPKTFPTNHLRLFSKKHPAKCRIEVSSFVEWVKRERVLSKRGRRSSQIESKQ
ncbi:MAG: hypothetical protein JWP89_4145 [Schlesneria sp.]|nr:hypothetical protein [Schlesneria sp.]